jgi:hypothetical protein
MYIKNRFCPCLRCKMNDMMGPVILVTFGVMLTLNNLTYAVNKFTVIGVVLIVIGAVKALQSSASTEGHVPPGSLPAGVVPPVPPSAPTNTTSTTSEAQNG